MTEKVRRSAAFRNEAMVVAFRSSKHNGELEAMAVKNLMDAGGIPAILSGPGVLPSLEFEVLVPEHLATKAHDLLRDARQNGRRAAEIGEAETAS